MVSTQHFENQSEICRYPACHADVQILPKYGKSTANCQFLQFEHKCLMTDYEKCINCINTKTKLYVLNIVLYYGNKYWKD